jgi:hypothetical protein
VGPGGGWLAKSRGRPARFYVGLDHGFMHKCLHEKGKDKAMEKVGGDRTTFLIGVTLILIEFLIYL